ncbi:glycosyltransferase family 4 protein [Akkermansiaceae bacterium]|nr:glycosyltransferase family 4 protein [Akkermansiaceae bacterium]
MSRVVIHFARFGPYHLARIESARAVLSAAGWDVVGLETGGSDHTYEWDDEAGPTAWRRVTVFPGEAVEDIPNGRMRDGVQAALQKIQPDAVAIAGWGSVDARACLDWCKRHGATAIVMSETREADGQRVWWREWIKGRIIRRFDAALVGARSHRDYLLKLGFLGNRIMLGYNVVANDYFVEECLRVKTSEVRRVGKYFLASNRFIERKNLTRLIDAYAQFSVTQPRTKNQESRNLWNLCLLGDGELKSDLINQCHDLGLKVVESSPWETKNQEQGTVFFPGFRQIDELPSFYAHAGCFVHPALEEPWGLVLNEAMACGLPILSGSNVGAAEELMDDGVNGWKFDAENTEEIVVCLERIVGMSVEKRRAFGEASVRILEQRCPSEAFGQGLVEILNV